MEPQEKEILENAQILRNNLEHWEQTKCQFENNMVKVRAAKKYNDKFPDKVPWSYFWDSRGLIIGGILNLDSLGQILKRIEQKI